MFTITVIFQMTIIIDEILPITIYHPCKFQIYIATVSTRFMDLSMSKFRYSAWNNKILVSHLLKIRTYRWIPHWPLEMYNKFVLAYQFSRPNPEIGQKMANMAGCYFRLCGYVNYIYMFSQICSQFTD